MKTVGAGMVSDHAHSKTLPPPSHQHFYYVMTVGRYPAERGVYNTQKGATSLHPSLLIVVVVAHAHKVAPVSVSTAEAACNNVIRHLAFHHEAQRQTHRAEWFLCSHPAR